MTEIDEPLLAASRGNQPESVRILTPGPSIRERVYEPWWPVAESADPATRIAAALALWNADFLALVPQYRDALRTNLVDVVVAQHPWLERPSLDYVVRQEGGGFAVWVGEDPRDFSIDPPLFDSVPAPVKTFVRTVHSGYTAYARGTCGIESPTHMLTLSDRWSGIDDDDDMLEWEDERPFPSTRRLLLISTAGTTSLLMTSPDLPAGTAVRYFEPEFELVDFGEALDTFMVLPVVN